MLTTRSGTSQFSLDGLYKYVTEVSVHKKFSAARTKCEAIVRDVIASFAMKLVSSELSNVSFSTVSTDASSQQATKLLPVTVQCFVPKKGIQVKLLDVHVIPGETSDTVTESVVKTSDTITESVVKTADTVTESVVKTVNMYNLNEKVVALLADNTNCNFGGARRLGKSNTFVKLQSCLNRNDGL